MDLFFQSGACSYAAFWKMTGGRALEATSLYPEIEITFTNLTKPFLKKLKARGGGLLASTYGTYDGHWILKAAIEKAGSADDVEKLIKTIEGGEFQRGFWVWAFDKKHDAKKGDRYYPAPYGQFQEDGRYVLIDPKNLVKITNPKDKYIRVKDLRKRAGLQ